MHNLIEKIERSNLSPNQYFLLFCLKNGIKPITESAEDIRILETKGYLGPNKHILPKYGEVFADPEMEEKALTNNAVRFSRIFPPMILPSGAHSRGHLNVIKPKLKAFIDVYNFDWETIFQAAENYVTRFKQKNYNYMRNCPNFVFNKDGESLLSLECEVVEHAKQIEEFGRSI